MKTTLFYIFGFFLSFSLNAQIYMYGTTYEGGANGLGTIYRVDQNGQNFQKVYDFSNSTGGKPKAGLTLANNGKLYGFTTVEGQLVNSGATTKFGSFFEFDPKTNTLSVVEYIDDKSAFGNDFNYSAILASNGLLYFASSSVGFSALSSKLSSYNPATNKISILATFDLSHGIPQSKLLQASNGHLYVTTNDGGLYSKGAVVRYNMNSNSLEVLHSSRGFVLFNYYEYQNTQNNNLVEASDGYLYGCSRSGGDTKGNIFRIDLSGGNYSTLDIFYEALADKGYYPTGLIQKNGKLYGTTEQEHSLDLNSGTIFEFDIATQTLKFLYTLDLEGARPYGTFVESPNGRLYVTCNGDNINSGSLIEYNTLNNNVTQRHSFSNNDGIYPHNNELSIVDFSTLGINVFNNSNFLVEVFPNPSSDFIEIKVKNQLQIKQIDIIDLKGKLVKNYNNLTNNQINTKRLTSGIYLLKIAFDNGASATKKIIIK